jgi:hypothetical protein
MAVMKGKCPAASIGTTSHAKTRCGTEIFAGALTVLQYFPPLLYIL